jgi:D-alanine-D-alanine ligase
MRRIVVVMGGESQEREVSRVTGTAVAKALAERGWDVALLDTGEGVRQVESGDSPAIGSEPPSADAEGLVPTGPQAISHLARSLDDADVVFIALHGGWGEDGTIQAFFEMLAIPYTGSGVLASALAMDKDRAKQVMKAQGIPAPAGEILVCPRGGDADPRALAAVRARFPGRVVVKPNAEGSTVGLSILEDGQPLNEAVRRAARFGDRVLVEEYIPGRELTVAVLAGKALPVVEIVPEGGLYTYEAKYTKGKSRYEVPADLPGDLAERLAASAVATFHALGCEGFARIDYRLREDGAFFCLEANTVPGMTPLSLVPMAAKAAGIGFGELIERIVEMGIARGTRRTRRPAETGVEG